MGLGVLEDLYKEPDVSNLRDRNGDTEMVKVVDTSSSSQNMFFLNLKFIWALN